MFTLSSIWRFSPGKRSCDNVALPRSQTDLGGDVAQFLERRTVTPLTQVQFPGAVRDFSPRVNFHWRLSCGVHTPLCAVACINICAHVKDPAVLVTVWWIIETPKYPACTVGWESVTLSQLTFPGESNPAIPWEQYQWDNTVVKKRRKVGGISADIFPRQDNFFLCFPD